MPNRDPNKIVKGARVYQYCGPFLEDTDGDEGGATLGGGPTAPEKRKKRAARVKVFGLVKDSAEQPGYWVISWDAPNHLKKCARETEERYSNLTIVTDKNAGSGPASPTAPRAIGKR